MKEGNNEERTDGKVKKTFRIEREYFDFMQGNLEVANERSVNAFVNRALGFYVGYVKTQHAENYLHKSLSSMIGATISLSEARIKSMIFKLAVELSMQNRILAKFARITEKDVEEIREASVEEVRRIMK